ncbi:MAG: 50S ribosomal protein L28 [Cytophagaceae bacterium]|jgi:large subunit ribosomal protein L28|nr:50S ribosomal protein L28 [Cytophagaceae bacterium]
MSKICEITGKKAGTGNHVSHSNHRTKRKFDVNLFYKKFYLPDEDRWVRLRVSASGLRLINKIGVHAAIRSAQENGFLSNRI